jgi:hypothetical protein
MDLVLIHNGIRSFSEMDFEEKFALSRFYLLLVDLFLKMHKQREHPAAVLSFRIRIFSLQFSFIIPRVVQIMSIFFKLVTNYQFIVLGNESTSASARVRFASEIE